MLKNLFKRKQPQYNSPMARDALRRLSGVPDNSQTGKAIQSTEMVMAKTMEAISSDLLNENDATKETSIYFLTGVALGYCHKFDVTDSEDIRAVVRCTMRSWIKNPAGADHLADDLGAYLQDEVFSGVVIDSAGSAVLAPNAGPDEIVLSFSHCLQEWLAFDVSSHSI